MRVFRTLGVAAAALALAVTGQSAAHAAAGPAPTYYVSLGDSLSQGYQPGPGNTTQGYVDDVYKVLKLTQPGLRMVKFGCSGETTTTLIKGGICSYGSHGSQLTAAERFLAAHRHHVRYVTIDIGGNDINACAGAGGVDLTCVGQAMRTVGTNLPAILNGLRTAGGNTPAYAGTGTYDPLLASWTAGPAGRTLAQQSVRPADAFNALEKSGYRAAGFAPVDPNAIWNTDDFTDIVPTPGYGRLPLNVAEICTLTYMCSQHNIHPNAYGYALIAGSFLRTFAETRH